jgi:hypothetical protein
MSKLGLSLFKIGSYKETLVTSSAGTAANPYGRFNICLFNVVGWLVYGV